MSGFRKFFFDDGRSRKRWHVGVRGRVQTVRYGRLGGSLRESTKSFSSPSEAKQKTEALVAKKKRDGYSEITPSRLEITAGKGIRGAFAKEVLALEKKAGCKLPEEYRHFLKHRNGGYPNPDCVALPGVPGFDNVGVGSLFHLRPSKPSHDEITTMIDQCAELLPAGHLPIAGSSDLFSISLKPKDFGAVYWWNHETDQLDENDNFLISAGYLLAGGFDEFLTRISLLYGDDLIEESDLKPKSSTRSKRSSKPTVKQLFRLIKHDHTQSKISEIEDVVQRLGDLSGVRDGDWPFTNIGNVKLLRCLLKAGLNPEIKDTEDQTLLWQCAGSVGCINLLHRHDVDLERRSGQEAETAFMRAVFLEKKAAVKRLIELGANPTVRLRSYISMNLKFNAALAEIVEAGRREWKKKKPSRTKAKRPSTKKTPLVTKGPKPTIHRLLRLMKQDFIPESFDEMDEILSLIETLGDLTEIQDGKWPKIDKFQCPILLKQLLAVGLNPNIMDKAGNPLLYQCAVHPESIKMLIKRGAEIDVRGKRGETPLMRATYAGDEDCVKTLLLAGADPTLEFDGLAKVLLAMDEEMSARIETARKRWRKKSAARKRN